MQAIFLQTLTITAPVFAMLFLGVVLKRVGWINDSFIHTASALVFNVTMPALLFLGILHADLSIALQPQMLGYFAVATLVSFSLAWGGRFGAAHEQIAGFTPRVHFAGITPLSVWR